jgi:hypothetical protein
VITRTTTGASEKEWHAPFQLARLSISTELTPLLPVLRGGLGGLSAAERAYLSETLAAVLGLTDATTDRPLALAADEIAALREADAAVAATLAAWRDQYGIA